jgi:hypothetical protein
VEASGRIGVIYRRSVELTGSKYAMIEKNREFSLVPWRLVLDRYLGRAVSGLSRSDSISWSLGQRRSSDISGSELQTPATHSADTMVSAIPSSSSGFSEANRHSGGQL